MKNFIVVALLSAFLMAGCATGVKSPFASADPQWQVEGATQRLDARRELAVTVVVWKYLRGNLDSLETKSRVITNVAQFFKAVAADDAVTGGLLNQVFDNWAADARLNPEDRLVLKFLKSELQIQGPDIDLPLSAEKRRVLSVYADAMIEAVNTFEG